MKRGKQAPQFLHSTQVRGLAITCLASICEPAAQHGTQMNWCLILNSAREIIERAIEGFAKVLLGGTGFRAWFPITLKSPLPLLPPQTLLAAPVTVLRIMLNFSVPLSPLLNLEDAAKLEAEPPASPDSLSEMSAGVGHSGGPIALVLVVVRSNSQRET